MKAKIKNKIVEILQILIQIEKKTREWMNLRKKKKVFALTWRKEKKSADEIIFLLNLSFKTFFSRKKYFTFQKKCFAPFVKKQFGDWHLGNTLQREKRHSSFRNELTNHHLDQMLGSFLCTPDIELPKCLSPEWFLTKWGGTKKSKFDCDIPLLFEHAHSCV